MTLASSSAVAVRAIKEDVFGVIPAAGDPKVLRITGETLKFNISKETSKEINLTRTNSSVIPVTANSSGAINAEISYASMDDFMEAVLQGTWAPYGVDGVGANVTADITTTTITASVATSGANLFTLLKPGQWFRTGGAGVNAHKILRVSTTTAPTATVITLDASTPGVASTAESINLMASRLTHGTDQTSFTIERENSDVGVFIAYTGMTPSKLSINIASGSLSGMSIDFMGKGGLESDTTQLPGTPIPAPTYDIHSGVSGATNAIWMDGAPITSTFVKSVALSFDNTLRSQEAIGTLGAVGIGSGTIVCTAQLSVYFADKDIFTKFRTNVNSSVGFATTDAAGNGYIFTLPKANVTDWTSNASAKDQDQMLDITVTALSDDANAVVALRKLLFVDRIGAAV